MADWPEASELAQVLDLENEDDWETTLEGNLQSAIDRVKADVGGWDDRQVPTDRQARAALRMAELMSVRPTADPDELGKDPTYLAHLKGSRRVFGFA